MSLWHSQWELFAPNFRDGKAHIPLNSTATLKLLPGPGFGDFSHPTTQLSLQLAAPLFPHHPVIDIGCGSGILSIAASLMGAPSVYGYDIDPDAVNHAIQNGKLYSSRHETLNLDRAKAPGLDDRKPIHISNIDRLTIVQPRELSHRPKSTFHADSSINHTPVTFSTSPPPKIQTNSLILMNMISSEQAAAWNTFLPSLTSPAILITSGVLDRDAYLTWAKTQGWTLIESLQKDNWWVFKLNV